MICNKKGGGRLPGGYTLVEVLIAMTVLSLTVASSILALRTGFSLIESARDNTLASQILQSEMENLRLKSWEQIEALSNGEFEIEESFSQAVGGRFVGSRVVTETKANFREVILRVEWTTSTGRTVSGQYLSFFSKTGLNDYYYRAFL